MNTVKQRTRCKHPVGTVKYVATLTDTFSGEANFSWVKTETFEAAEMASQATLIRLAKKALNVSGVRGITQCLGEEYVHRFYGPCWVMFVKQAEEETE